MGLGRCALFLALAGALAPGAGCLSLGDSSSDNQPDAAPHDSGSAGLDGAGWPDGAGGSSDGAAGSSDGAGGTPGTGCDAGQLACSGTCVDPTSDPNNCGACGTVCTAPTATCLAGACVCNLDAVCNDVCVSLTSNKNNCGGCGNKCPSGYGCHGGQCCQGC